ncbi:hypothetical protein HPP92_012930 [Vanilla planifolia]|uniref:Uncharacterized protein n=1 Tax=Vanilla planifolia TaxID=51239 RepID=A0A835V057_VANPL|nr:hypothetical protein HPP92_012930 [Vanilla planifolia]
MAVGVSLQMSHAVGVVDNHVWVKPLRISEIKRCHHLPSISLSLSSLVIGVWNQPNARYHWEVIVFVAISHPMHVREAFSGSYIALLERPLLLRLAPAIGIIVFAVWGLGPALRLGRNLFRHDKIHWKKSRTHFVFTSYLQPLLLWAGATLLCRALDPVILPSETSQVVKQRLLNFVRSLSTVLAFAYCLSSLIQKIQEFFMEKSNCDDTRNMGFQFAGRAVYTAVWIAAFSLFMELLGFSTQKWLTAGGLGTVLLTLAGREIFTNFLSSVMIHATRPFILNEWIQTKIEGYEVSGTVENIVADMRKVLAKNPQIEQQRLHRRVFLDNIDPENQALLILISCFVKTSHFEEYLCVKEAVLLDLLRVISHHRARLATPIRTVQKFYDNSGTENIPYSTIFTRSVATDRPLLLIDPLPKIHGDEKTKSRSLGGRGNEELGIKTPTASEAPQEKHQQKKVSTGDTREKSGKMDSSTSPTNSSSHSIPTPHVKSSRGEKSTAVSDSPTDQAGRPSFEDNIVLGVALEGSKRTLPIEEVIEQSTASAEAKEVGAARNSNGASPPSS